MKIPFFSKKTEESAGKDKTKVKRKKKSEVREWSEALIFAIIAASLIRWLLIEPFTIPSSSMEGSLLEGDYLFVSKVNYGARTPRTLLTLPLMHNKIPGTELKSYLEWLQLPYNRLPGYQDIKNNDVVVFNYPNDPDHGPVDKRENYIKRCIAIAGDTLEIINGAIYINGEAFDNHKSTQFRHIVRFKHPVDPVSLLKSIDLPLRAFAGYVDGASNREFKLFLNAEKVEELKALSGVASVDRYVAPEGAWDRSVFPNMDRLPWNVDNIGPLYIPAKGDTLFFSPLNYYMYKNVIRDYEGNSSLHIEDNVVYIDGEAVDYYIFQMDYYYMVGDNRHNSLDSRMWGFVPEDHIVGKAVLLWFSVDREKPFFQRIRWRRLFTSIR
jgi:signal peptidase I